MKTTLKCGQKVRIGRATILGTYFPVKTYYPESIGTITHIAEGLVEVATPDGEDYWYFPPSTLTPIDEELVMEIIDVKCRKCGGYLDLGFDNTRLVTSIDPCENCLRDAKDDGWVDGYITGYDNGFLDGHKEGYDEGFAAGREDK